MKRKRFTRLLVLGLLVIALLAAVTTVSVEALDTLGLSWWTVDGGGGLSSGGSYTLHGGIGQPDAGNSVGDSFSLSSGFWNGLAGLFRLFLPMVIR